MAFVLFLLVNFVLLVRPQEFLPGMIGWHLYEPAILVCLVFWRSCRTSSLT